MRKQFLLLQAALLLICIAMILTMRADSRKFRFYTKEDSLKQKIIPVPVLYGKRTKLSKNPYFDSNLAIVEVIDNAGKVDSYRTAIGSVQCYAALKGHYMYLLYVDEYMSICGHHQDFFYRRHCVTANLMATRKHNWYVFLDSDMEIINPNKAFSDYIDDRFHVNLYDRFWNWEIMAGSFIVKGSKFGLDFVKGFANFEFEHPKIAHHGTDNGAIQAYVAEIVLNGRDKIHECWELWKLSQGWDNMFDHEWCVRKALGSREEFDKVKIFRKGTAWARDGGLTGGKWSPEIDFVFHLRKEAHKLPWNPNMTEYWYDTRLDVLDLPRCEDGTVRWQFRPELMVNKTTIVDSLTGNAKGIVSFLRAVYGRINKTDVIEKDIAEHKDVIEHFSNFHLD